MLVEWKSMGDNKQDLPREEYLQLISMM